MIKTFYTSSKIKKTLKYRDDYFNFVIFIVFFLYYIIFSVLYYIIFPDKETKKKL